MRAFLRDLALGARTLRATPGFTITAIVTLALGIGASTAIFSVVNAVLLRPLPYAEPQRLTIVTQDLRARGVVDFPVGPGDVPDIRNGTPALADIAVLQTARNATLTKQDGTPELITAAAATPNIFRVLGVPMLMGRDLADKDGTPNEIPPAAPGAPPQQNAPPRLPTIGILGYDFWQREYGGDPAVVGKTITVFGGPVEIVGVASPRAELLFPVAMQVVRRPDVWTALRVNFETGSRMNVAFRLVGRLAPGATLAEARAQLARVSADLQSRFPIDKTAGVTYRAEPMKAYLVANVRTAILALMGAVVLVLLIACANVANLLLVRAARRERELAVRAAIGASPWSIVRQMLAESLVLATTSAAVGVGIAVLGTKLLLRLAPANLPRLADVSVDGTVLAFAVLTAFAAAIVFGLVPALRAASPELAQVLRAGGRTPALGRAARLRNAVIVAEVALSFVLLVGSGLMVRSFVALAHTDPGFEPSGLLTFGITNARFRSRGEAVAFTQRVHDALAGMPGVSAVTQSSALPLDGSDPSFRWGTQAAASDPTRFRQGGFFAVAPEYFQIMRTPLVAGRIFAGADNDSASHSIIVDDATARLAFGSPQAAIGQTLLGRVRTDQPEQFTVVGVVKHQRHISLFGDEKESFFFPAGAFGGFGTWIVRTSGDPAKLTSAVRGAVASVDPKLIVTDLRPMSELVDRAMSGTRFVLVLIGVFATIAAVLAAVGLYGVLSSVVRQRTSEIGIRMAFGAQRSSIVALVLGQGMRLAAIGLGAGLLIALATTRVLASMLVEVRATDPLTFAAMLALFLLISGLACMLPARRAAGLDPNAALREE